MPRLIGGIALSLAVGAVAVFLIGRSSRRPAAPDRQAAEHVLCRRAEEEARSGLLDTALRDAERDLEQHPDCARAHLLAGLLYERRSEGKPALEHLGRAAQAYPDDPKVQTAYGRVLALTGDYARAEEILRRVTEGGGDRAEPFRWLGYVYLHLQQSSENVRRAEENLRQALEREPGYAEANYDLALLLFRQDKAREALPYAQTAAARRQHDPRGLYLLSRINRVLGNLEEAARFQKEFQHEDALVGRQKTLSARLTRDPGDIAAILEMARTMEDRGKPEEALRYLRRAVRRAPEDARVKAALAQQEAKLASDRPAGEADAPPGAGAL